ncbi:MAG: IS4 family transposase [Thermoguttaceae bacterium]
MARTQQKFERGIGIGERLSIASICRSFNAGSIREALAVTGKRSHRKRDLPADVVLYYVIAMALFMHVNLREVLFCLMEGLRLVRGVELKVAGKSGISQARTRIGAEPLRYLYEHHVKPLANKNTEGAWYHGRRLVSLDGSYLDLADEKENRQAFGGPSTYKECSAFPQMRFVCLAEIGTHVLFGARMGAYRTSEVTLAREVIPMLTPGTLCLADQAFGGLALWNQALATGADLLWRVRAARNMAMEKLLPDGTYLSRLRVQVAREGHKESKPVRVIEYLVEGVEASQNKMFRLITTLLDHRQFPAEELARLYQQRWEIETAFDELKTHLRGARMCLRSKTPELVCWRRPGIEPFRRPIESLAGGSRWRLTGGEVAAGGGGN